MPPVANLISLLKLARAISPCPTFPVEYPLPATVINLVPNLFAIVPLNRSAVLLTVPGDAAMAFRLTKFVPFSYSSRNYS